MRTTHTRTCREGQILNRWTRWLPGLQTLGRYEAAWLPRDLMAGLVLTTMLVPVGIAYAVASGVPGIYGLYATIVPLLAYALFGPSRILVLGPDSSLAAVILAVVFRSRAASRCEPWPWRA
jgi:MFS superfamily sulfate permease-like transporter